MNNTDKLLRMKQKTESAKIEFSKLEGKQEQLYESLKKDFNCSDITEAEDKLKKIDADLTQQENIFIKGISDLKEKYDWDNKKNFV